MNEETIIAFKPKKRKMYISLCRMNCKKVTYFKTLQFPVTIQLEKVLSNSNILRIKMLNLSYFK